MKRCTARLRLGALILVPCLFLAACSSKKPAAGVPGAAGLLSQAAVVMRDVTSAHVSLQVDGSLAPLPVRSADGVVARGGKAKATAVIALGSLSVTYQIVEIGGTTYLKGPTGGFSGVSTTSLYDVSLLLDPDRGVASLLSQATGGITQGREHVAGVDTYRLTASVPTAVVQGLANLAPGQDRVSATLWIAVTGDHLIQASIPLKIEGSTKVTTVTAQLSEFNAPVDITAPVDVTASPTP